MRISDTGVGDITDINVTLTWYEWNTTATTGDVPVNISDGQTGTPVVNACFNFPDNQLACNLGSAKATLTGELFLGSTSAGIGGQAIDFCPPGVSPR